MAVKPSSSPKIWVRRVRENPDVTEITIFVSIPAPDCIDVNPFKSQYERKKFNLIATAAAGD